MLLTAYPDNLDERVVARAAAALANGALVAFPTDSSFTVACDSQSRDGVTRLKKLKGIGTFTPAVLTSDLRQWNDFVELDNAAFRVVKGHVPGPFVFIFDARPSLRNPFGMKRLEFGLRLPDHPLPRALVEAVGRPLFGITASRQLSEPGWWDDAFAQEYLFDAAAELEELPGVELILDPGDDQPKVLTTVVDFTSGSPVLVRQGVGEWNW